jgi:Mn-dependent DtxR family transcriptional regulator
MSKNEMTSAMLKYLKVLKEIDPAGRGIRSIEIARALQVSRSSVHTMMDRLNDSGCVVKGHYGIVYLTEKGMAAAEG